MSGVGGLLLLLGLVAAGLAAGIGAIAGREVLPPSAGASDDRLKEAARSRGELRRAAPVIVRLGLLSALIGAVLLVGGLALG